VGTLERGRGGGGGGCGGNKTRERLVRVGVKNVQKQMEEGIGLGVALKGVEVTYRLHPHKRDKGFLGCGRKGQEVGISCSITDRNVFLAGQFSRIRGGGCN